MLSMRPSATPVATRSPESPGPPTWILGLGSVAQTVSCVLLILYLLGRLQCDKYVHSVLWLTALWWSVGVAWFLGTL